MDDAPQRGAPSSVRGWLSEVYMPALVSAQAEQLARRLGHRATVDDPIFGRAQGTPALLTYLERAATWLTKHDGAFDSSGFTTGSDRDVTEGTLSVTVEGARVKVPVAVVAERRPEREVEIRLYYSTRLLLGKPTARTALVPRDDDLPVPPPVSAHLLALARGDVDAVVASFEPGGTVRDPLGREHIKEARGGALHAFFDGLLAGASSGGAAIQILKGARADDGRTCALEYSVTVAGTPQPALAVYERGDSGLLRAARLYHDL
jgi:hypothetical protein